MTEPKLTFSQISDLLQEYSENEVTLYVLYKEDTYGQTIDMAKRRLDKRQDEIHKLIMIACGLEVE